MANHSSATERGETPRASNTNSNERNRATISNAVRRRAESVINDRSIDAQSRAVIRYGLETNDPWLGELVRRFDAGETIIGAVDALFAKELLTERNANCGSM